MKPRTATNFIVIHCSATRANQDCTVEDIRRWHVQERGWSDVGYHWVVERNGKLKQGRNSQVWGAHVQGRNHDSVGVCLVGGMAEDGQPEDNFTSEQMLVLEMLIESLQLRYPGAQVVGHYFFTPYKTCPNFILEEWLQEIR